MFRHITYAIFFWQLVNKTADYFNNIVFILVAKISSKKVYEKMKTNWTLENVLLVCKRNAKLLRLVGATFDSKVVFLRRMRKKNVIILKTLQKKVCHFIFMFVVVDIWFVNINWKCLENCNTLTERTYDSVVFKFFFNVITICICIKQ